MPLTEYFVDLHIHIGRTMYDRPVKITASKTLTLTNILKEASNYKGLDMVGIIDAHVPAVQEELVRLIHSGKAYELEGGGIRFQDTTLILGSEIELYDENCRGPVHVLCYFPDLDRLKSFAEWLKERMKNIHLSSQRFYGTARELQHKVKELDGLFIPAHVFTPFKSLYGKGVVKSLKEIFHPDLIDGIELGLSSDSHMADHISELRTYTFVTNSDAHSLKKMAREYQVMEMTAPTFDELRKVLHQSGGRSVRANYGMNPKLGKYYTTVCEKCLTTIDDQKVCPKCSHSRSIKGVFDRIQELKDREPAPNSRPPYIYQAPLEYIPGLGPKTYENLLKNAGTEMYILHQATRDELQTASSEKIADHILAMRSGQMNIAAGGGGKYGKLKTD